MKIFKISVALFFILINLSLYCSELKKFDFDQVELLTCKTFKALIQEQFEFEKKYFLVEIKTTDNKIHYYDAHSFNIYHFGTDTKKTGGKKYPVKNKYPSPITSKDLTTEEPTDNKIILQDRITDLYIKQIKYYVFTKKQFTLAKDLTWDDFYRNYPNITFHFKLALSYLNSTNTRAQAKLYFILAAKQNVDLKIKSYALENLISFFSSDTDAIKNILKSTDLNQLEASTKNAVNLFLVNEIDANVKLAIQNFEHSQSEKAAEHFKLILNNLNQNIRKYLSKSQMSSYCEACYYFAKYQLDKQNFDEAIKYFKEGLLGTKKIRALSHYYIGTIYANEYFQNSAEETHKLALENLHNSMVDDCLDQQTKKRAYALIQKMSIIRTEDSIKELSNFFKQLDPVICHSVVIDGKLEVIPADEESAKRIERTKHNQLRSMRPYRKDIEKINTRKCPCDECTIL